MACVSHVLPPGRDDGALPDVRGTSLRSSTDGILCGNCLFVGSPADGAAGPHPTWRNGRSGSACPALKGEREGTAEATVPHSCFVFFAGSCTLRLLPISSLVLAAFAFASPTTGNRSSMASTGAWMGSTIDGVFLRKLRRNGFLGVTGDVEARAPPAGEISPKPKKGEFVVF